MIADKKTIGMTAEGRKVMDTIMEKGLFDDMMPAAKFAMSLAINNGVAMGQLEGADTTWNIGSFDPDGEMRGIITAFYPSTKTPYRLIEYLVNTGLGILGRQLAANPNLDLTDLAKSRKPADSD